MVDVDDQGDVRHALVDGHRGEDALVGRESRSPAHLEDEVMTVETIREVFALDCVVIDDPVSHTPLVVPIGTNGRGVHPEG